MITLISILAIGNIIILGIIGYILNEYTNKVNKVEQEIYDQSVKYEGFRYRTNKQLEDINLEIEEINDDISELSFNILDIILEKQEELNNKKSNTKKQNKKTNKGI